MSKVNLFIFIGFDNKMKIFLVILLTWCLCNMHVGAILGFGRTDCSCTCADGTICKKAIPNFLEFKFRECQCDEGTCPSQSLYNGIRNFKKSNIDCEALIYKSYILVRPREQFCVVFQ